MSLLKTDMCIESCDDDDDDEPMSMPMSECECDILLRRVLSVIECRMPACGVAEEEAELEEERARSAAVLSWSRLR